MTNVLVQQMPIFKKAYRKLYFDQKQYVDDAIRAIIADHKIGQAKKWDLAGVFVYKFKMHHLLK